MAQKNAVYLWDVTIKRDGNDVDHIKKAFKKIAKRWVFQEELGETGYAHYQPIVPQQLWENTIKNPSLML